MKQYKELVEYVLENGERRTNRTGVDTISVFGFQQRYDLRLGFPILTTKKVKFDLVVKELLWFLRAETNINTLGCKIWDAWSTPEGELKYCYGKMWRQFPGINIETDQICNLLESIKTNPDSRRHIITAWHPQFVEEASLPWCHVLSQFNVSGVFLDLQLYQRSADIALGVPFNIASYALLLSLVAKECGLIPRNFIHTFGDAHIYVNHVDGLKEQIKREVLTLPNLELSNKSFWETKEEDIKLLAYKHEPFIRFDVAV